MIVKAGFKFRAAKANIVLVIVKGSFINDGFLSAFSIYRAA